MRIRDKIITAVCRTVKGIEWTTVKVGQDGTEQVHQDSAPVTFSGETAEELIAAIELPEEIAEKITGDISVPLRSADLLMRVMELPTAKEDEIADMAALQIDKISPFPIDQLAFSHEILQQSEDTSLVLMATAKRSCIDAIGDTFKEQGVRIHSIDSRVLGWMQLLKTNGHIAGKGCEIVIIDDGIDFSLVVVLDGIPLAFRMLHADADDMNVVDELVYEIGYTLTTLSTEYDLATPGAIQFWNHNGLSTGMRTKLAEKSGLKVRLQDLGILPPLSKGIVQRALADHSRIELIPSEWIEHEKRQQLNKKTIFAASVVAGVWLVIVLGFFAIFKTRDIQLSSAKKRANAIAPKARQALENRQKLKALKVYTDRSDSALECLREITRMLPPGDIELGSFNYNKNKGVSVRGSAGNDDVVDDFFIKLATSSLFEEIRDQSSNPQISKGVRRYVFTATLVLPSTEEI